MTHHTTELKLLTAEHVKSLADYLMKDEQNLYSFCSFIKKELLIGITIPHILKDVVFGIFRYADGTTHNIVFEICFEDECYISEDHTGPTEIRSFSRNFFTLMKDPNTYSCVLLNLYRQEDLEELVWKFIELKDQFK
jgi:hypothetical protein